MPAPSRPAPPSRACARLDRGADRGTREHHSLWRSGRTGRRRPPRPRPPRSRAWSGCSMLIARARSIGISRQRCDRWPAVRDSVSDATTSVPARQSGADASFWNPAALTATRLTDSAVAAEACRSALRRAQGANAWARLGPCRTSPSVTRSACAPGFVASLNGRAWSGVAPRVGRSGAPSSTTGDLNWCRGCARPRRLPSVVGRHR